MGRKILFGYVLFLVSLVTFSPRGVLAADCVGGSSGNTGECSTIAGCTGSAEAPSESGACKSEQICCVQAGALPPSEKPSKDPAAPASSEGGSSGDANQGAACATPTGGTGTCRFVTQCSPANLAPASSCLGGTMCCLVAGNTNTPGPGTGTGTGTGSGAGVGAGAGSGASCAGGNGTCTTINNCTTAPFSDPTACSTGLVCCPEPVTTGTSAGTTTTLGSLNCATGYQKVAGVCFPAGTGLSEKTVLEIIAALVSWLLAIFGFIALLGFIISGIQYLLSTGDEGMAETAKRNMKYSIIGIIVALSGWIIIKAVDALLNANSLI